MAACILAVSTFFPAVSEASTPVTVTPIHQIQGNGFLSPLNNTEVMTEGVITAVVADGYYIQTIFGSDDGNPLTSQGLFVYTNIAPAANIVSGALVRIIGTVEEYRPTSEPHQLSFTRLKNITSTVIVSPSNPLPSAITLTDADLNDGNSIDWMERFEGMRVRVSQLKVTQPVGGTLNETTGVATLNGIFYGVMPSTARPTREPGIAITDNFIIPAGKSIPFFDRNPESLRVDSSRLTGASALSPDVDDSINNLIGVLDYKNGTPSLLALPNASTSVSLGSHYLRGARSASFEEVSIGIYNFDRFFDDVNDPAINEPVLNTGAYQTRLAKVSSIFCAFISRPYVLAVFEIENKNALQQVVEKINSDTNNCPVSPRYSAHLIEGNDAEGLDSGLIISEELLANNKPRIELLSLEQIDSTKTFTNLSGSTEKLFDRPSLLAKIRANNENNNSLNISLIISDLLSNVDVNSLAVGTNGWLTKGEYIRKKRAAQAASLAQYIQDRQVTTPTEKIVVAGNFKTHAFSDGYVDVMGILTGRETAQNNIIEYVDSPITEALTNQSTLLDELFNIPEEQNSSISQGNSERLEHFLFNKPVRDSFATAWATTTVNAYFGIDLFNDTSIAVRASRDEATVTYLFSEMFRSIDLTATAVQLDAIPGPELGSPYRASSLKQTNYDFTIWNEGRSPAKNVSVLIKSTLPPAAWSVTYFADPNISCVGPTATVSGSQVNCTITELPNAQYVKFAGLVPANPNLNGITASFEVSVSHSGSSPDLDTSNNIDTTATRFSSKTDLLVEKIPSIALPPNPGDQVYTQFQLKNISINNAGQTTVKITINAPPSEAEVTASSWYNTFVSCIPSVGQIDGKTTWTCDGTDVSPGSENDYFRVLITTSLGSGGKIYEVTVEATPTLEDENSANNRVTEMIKVNDNIDFKLTGYSTDPTPILLDKQALFVFGLGYNYQGVARNPKIEMIFDVPPVFVEPGNNGSYSYYDFAQAPTWDCGNAEAYGANQSRVTCRSILPYIKTWPSANLEWLFVAKVTPELIPGLANRILNATIKFSSDSMDTDQSNNTISMNRTVIQSTDLTLNKIIVNGVGNPTQVTEPEEITYSVSPSFEAFSNLINVPKNARINFELNALIPSSQIKVYKGSSTNRVLMSCAINPNTPAGRTSIICPESVIPNSDYVTVIVKTFAELHDKTLTLTATVTNDLLDTNLANNTQVISTLVIGKADLCVSPNDTTSDIYTCGGINFLLPSRIVVGDKELFTVNYRNFGPSVAKNTKAKFRVGVAASRLTARILELTYCGAATAISANESELVCDLGNVAANVLHRIEFWIDTAGYVNAQSVIPYKVTFSTDTEDTYIANNVFTSSVPVAPIVDLSSQVVTKGDGSPYTSLQDFYIMLQANGPSTTSPSRVKITTLAPGARTYPQLIASGWSCSFVSGGTTDAQYECNRNTALPVTTIDRILLRFQPNFMQIGETITVSSEHIYSANALAVDRNAVNNTGSTTRRIAGRRLLTEPVKPSLPPVSKPARSPITQPSVESKRKKTIH